MSVRVLTSAPLLACNAPLFPCWAIADIDDITATLLPYHKTPVIITVLTFRGVKFADGLLHDPLYMAHVHILPAM